MQVEDNPDPQSRATDSQVTDGQANSISVSIRQIWRRVRNRIFEGLLVVLPIVITLWVIRWLYTFFEKYVIDPFATMVLWKARRVQGEPDLPAWFEYYAAPAIAILIVLALLYCCGFLAHSRLRNKIDQILLRLPLISVLYDAIRNVVQGLDKPAAQSRPQRLVLISFPHLGMKLPAFVTSTCRDIKTQKTLLCVYVPTTPVPTSGFFLMVPEEEATDLNWSTEQALQAIISGGLTAPPEVSYFKTMLPSQLASHLKPAGGDVSTNSIASPG